MVSNSKPKMAKKRLQASSPNSVQHYFSNRPISAKKKIDFKAQAIENDSDFCNFDEENNSDSLINMETIPSSMMKYTNERVVRKNKGKPFNLKLSTTCNTKPIFDSPVVSKSHFLILRYQSPSCALLTGNCFSQNGKLNDPISIDRFDKINAVRMVSPEDPRSKARKA